MAHSGAKVVAVLVSCSSLFAAGLVPLFRATTKADQAVDWTSLVPTISKTSDFTTLPTVSNSNCQPMQLQVVHGLTAQSEDHCVIGTPYGDFDTSSQTFQPASYQKSYQLDRNLGGNPALWPLPGRNDALSIIGAANTGVNMGVYNDMFAHLGYEVGISLATNFPYAHYVLKDLPDWRFTYGDGAAVQFNAATVSTSANGRYVLADTIYNDFVLIDMDSRSMRPVLPSIYSDSSTGQLFAATTAVDNSGSFAAVAYNAPGGWGGEKYLRISDVRTCDGLLNYDSHIKPAYSCKTANLYPYLQAAIAGLENVVHVQFVNDHDLSIIASYRTQDNQLKFAQYNLVAAGQAIRSEQYEALGDSYTSGEGAYSYRQETDNGRNRCHQSTVSYPYLLGADFDSFASLACSGAKLQNVIPEIGKNVFQVYGAVPTKADIDQAFALRLPGVNAQKDFIDRDNPRVVTVSIGGNDVGFGNILAKCVHPLQKVSDIKDKLVNVETCYRTYEDRLEVVNQIDAQFIRLRSLYQRLVASPAGDRRVYVVGYPQIAKVGGDCGSNVQMNNDEIQFAHDLIAYLDSVVAMAADQAGARYVDIQPALEGHLLCQAGPNDSAVNGFTVGKSDDGGYNFTASFHPTALGQRLVASSIAVQTSNLTDAMPQPSVQTAAPIANPGLAILQNVPHTNRLVRVVRPIADFMKAVVTLKFQIDETLSARDYLFKAGGIYNLVINSEPVTLATTTADANGDVHFDAGLPANISPGIHTIHVYGSDIFGNPLDIQQAIYVAASDEDYDGDGLPNAMDSCVLAVQSGLDENHDGVDDACSPPFDPASLYWNERPVLPISIDARR